MKSAINKYIEFHSFDPEETGEFDRRFKIPSYACKAGKALEIMYRSNKWEKKKHDYIHTHSDGVICYRLDIHGSERKVPKRICNQKALVRLGECLGFSYVDEYGDEVEAIPKTPYPELYCTPDGKSLLVVQDKRDLLALMWGGKLRVEGRGIVN
jgi:hypothetical protein